VVSSSFSGVFSARVPVLSCRFPSQSGVLNPLEQAKEGTLIGKRVPLAFLIAGLANVMKKPPQIMVKLSVKTAVVVPLGCSFVFFKK